MKTVGIDNDIKAGDEIAFVLDTKDGSGCVSDPYQVMNATVYFVSREFTETAASEYVAEFDNPEILAERDRIKKAVCLKSKQDVRSATTSPVTLSGVQTIDSVALSAGDRVLVKDQLDSRENGIYVVSAGTWPRSLDASSASNIVPGMYVFAEEGVANGGRGWVLEAEAPIVLGSSELKFLLFSTNRNPLSPDEAEEENIRRLEALDRLLAGSKLKSSFFYKDAVPVKVFGGETDPNTGEVFPAWLNPDKVPAETRAKVISDNILSRLEEGGEPRPGRFVLAWDTSGMREGDYFICWSWRPTFGAEVLSAHEFFHLGGDGDSTASIPTHRVDPRKYETLMERYTPDMFKTRISDSDLSPEVISEFGKAVAKGFSFVEDQAGAVIDLLDANVIHEQLLPLLANMFNLKVKSSDPTLWRRQIKKAIPNFKKKGSLAGLREVLKDSGMRLLRLARMWQVVPKYTFQEHFTFSGTEANPNEFTLSRVPETPLDQNFALWFRGKDDASWAELGPGTPSSSSSSGHWSESFVSISGETMTWVGSPLSVGDSVRVKYRFRSMPSGDQALEDYVRSLPLMDERDERLQDYPPKNWNVHLLEEDDEHFDIIVPVRHPLSDPIVWGRVRTEFPYSENLYNMEEYNGSKRDSMNPCDIDKEFMDPCGQCATSKFNLDVEVEMLSDESFKELGRIVEENMPFHAVPNSFNLWGAMNEFVGQSEERIQAMISYRREDVVVAGEAQMIFNRSVYDFDLDSVKRNILASYVSLPDPGGAATWAGTLRNTRTLLLAMPTNEESNLENSLFNGKTQGFDSLNVSTNHLDSDPMESDNLLEVLSTPHKYYSISSIDKSAAVINGIVDASIVGPLFEYRISNKIGDFNVNIQQYEELIFEDYDSDFSMLGLITQHDVDLGLSSGVAWRLLFGSKRYVVSNMLPDGRLMLAEEATITPVSGWILKNGTEEIKTGINGVLTATNYGLVEVNSGPSPRDFVKPGDFVYMGSVGSLSYHEVRSFKKDEDKFYIKDYSAGGVGGEDVRIYRRIMDEKVGQIGHDGLVLDLESSLPVSSENLDDLRENHLVFVGGKYYTISGIDGNTARLSGPQSDLDTVGEVVGVNIYKFLKGSLALSEKQVPPYDEKPREHEFDRIGRSGSAVITNTEGGTVLGALSSVLNSGGPVDLVSQGERIEYNVEYREEK